MKIQILKLLLSVLAFPACAAYQPQPLSQNHPAHGDAASAPRQAPSLTLAYTRADMPSQQSATAKAVEHQVQAETPVAAAVQQTVEGEGKVVATVPSASQLVVEHGEINGFMEAMTMGYRVDPPALLKGIKSGDKVRFTIDVPRKAIIKIERPK